MELLDDGRPPLSDKTISRFLYVFNLNIIFMFFQDLKEIKTYFFPLKRSYINLNNCFFFILRDFGGTPGSHDPRVNMGLVES